MSDETRDHVLPGTDEDLDTEPVEGYDFTGDLDIEALLESYETTGFQATHLYEAIKIIEKMQDDDAKIYLTFTSNIISSGLREAVAALARKDAVDVMITTSGSITEDIIKTLKPFRMGEWDADEAMLREQGINRLGNIFVESDCYIELESFLQDFFPEFFDDENVRTPREMATALGARIDDEQSFLNHAEANDIPVYCPALIDAEIGNFLFYYQQEENPDAGIEILDDYGELIQHGLDAETTGLIVVGGGVPKHQAIMTSLFRGGADYAVYISTGMEGDGSLSGAPPEEAVSWGKIKERDEFSLPKDKNYTEIEAEATLVLPLIIAAAFDDLDVQ